MRLFSALAGVALMCLPAIPAWSQAPHFDRSGTQTALVVDGEPYLALAVQANNSSNYPAMLETVWPMVERLHANTLLMPVAWEQVEPEEGLFDLTFLDTLLEQARAHDKRLVLLWYGAFKNTAPGYAPAWVKRDGERFPRMRTPEGSAHYALSPHAAATREADARAFAQVMRHLARIDRQHTVIMVQVENETGSYRLARDHADGPARLFAQPIPQELADGLGIARGTWSDAFGPRAEQYFMSWHMASYVEAVARTGLAEWELPVLVNAALGDAFTDGSGDVGPSGGPNWNALPIWRIAAPSVDAYGPDIYNRNADAVVRYLDRYGEGGWPLLVPEIGNARDYARFIWPALGRGGVMFSPFGMDRSGYINHPLGAAVLDEETLEAFAAPYRFLAPAARDWARIAMDRPTWGTARGQDGSDQSHEMGRWQIDVQYGRWMFGEDDWSFDGQQEHPLKDVPTGGMMVAQLDTHTFLLAGQHVRVRFALADGSPGEQAQIIEAQEGTFVDGEWVMRRRWNGDQVDYGFNFGEQPVWLRVEMGTYR
ncbi:beta-galactosidase [Aurantiacibacter zhengii]|uniref:Beta-galactosidase n=2 Tax=Aurantiacibacter zhengii TaxID=2307003 RepID=A0A418NVL7_9SPHN|nr:beta-galactosidase [Aurantiacibacter zhengii]